MTTEAHVVVSAEEGATSMARPSLFTSSDEILGAFQERYIKGRRVPPVFKWIGPSRAPSPLEEADTAVVLSVSFGTLEETFDRACEWLSEVFPGTKRWGHLFSDADYLQLLHGMQFHPWTCAWQTIRLNTHVGKRPYEVVHANFPAVGTLFAAVQHPERIRRIDGRAYPSLWLSGLHCRSPHERKPLSHALHQFPRTPFLTFNSAKQIPELASSWNTDVEPGFSIPVLVDGAHP